MMIIVFRLEKSLEGPSEKTASRNWTKDLKKRDLIRNRIGGIET